MIPHSRPTIEKEDIKAVSDVMKSLHIAIGPKTREFEKKMSAYIGVNDTVATSSGTTALHLALECLGVDKKDEVILPTGVCHSLLNSIYYCGAKPILVDIDYHDLNLSVADVKRKTSSKTKAIIVPHMYGKPADLYPLLDLGIYIIEDCAHAIGACIGNKKAGSIGDAAMFSFYATKMMATGEGGMVTFKSKEALNKARDLREYNFKKTYKIRYNYKMTDMQAALGITQLGRLPEFIQKRKALAESYNKALRSIPAILPDLDGSVFYRYIMHLKKPNVKKIVKALEKSGVSSQCPIHPLHRLLNVKGFNTAEKALKTALSIPIYPSLSEMEFDTIVKAVKAEVK
ncbi:MAG: DegT/DnrJ/EryC1/StrS family aminotransferase [Thermoplasmata archaeon]|nr:MAG: DegT/DnrJ/EryC1/StrS family aminotransferase [Thermoplasmata archaeon]